jgi:hypothetical protein
MNSRIRAAIIAAMAAADQHAAKSRAWQDRLPDHFRAGDVLIVHPDGIKSAPGYVWVLVKQHPCDPHLWLAAIADDRSSLVGEADLYFQGAVSQHVVRPSVVTWMHEDDLVLENRIDHATESVIDYCGKVAARPTPEQIAADDESSMGEVDPDYLDHIEDLRRWETVVTECLHSDHPDAPAAEKAYWSCHLD